MELLHLINVFVTIYSDDKIKTTCGIKNWNVSMSVKCQLLHIDKILRKFIKGNEKLMAVVLKLIERPSYRHFSIAGAWLPWLV